MAYHTPASTRSVGVSQQVWVLDGPLELTVGEATHALGDGDCLAMRLDGPIVFHNPGDRAARFLVALAADRSHP